jgi:hypothetical protein
VGAGTLICGRGGNVFQTTAGGWEWKTCPTCKGAGFVIVEEAHGFEGSGRHYRVSRPCTNCFGRRTVEEYTPPPYGQICPCCGWRR